MGSGLIVLAEQTTPSEPSGRHRAVMGNVRVGAEGYRCPSVVPARPGPCFMRMNTDERSGATTRFVPTITIRPSSGWAALHVLDVWRYRELLYFFVWRDLKVRYRQTIVGALWAIFQPILLVAVFTLVFRLASPGIILSLVCLGGPRPMDAACLGPARRIWKPRRLGFDGPEGVLPAIAPAGKGDRVVPARLRYRHAAACGLVLFGGYLPTILWLWFMPSRHWWLRPPWRRDSGCRR